MRAPAPALRSLALLRAGIVTRPSRSAPASVPSVRRAARYLVPLLLLAALAACDGSGPTGPDSAESGTPHQTWRDIDAVRPTR